MHTHFLNRTNLNALKYELIGDEKGLTRDNWGATAKAAIPALKEKIDEIEKRFESFQKQARAEGKEMPLRMTPEQEEEYFLVQALCDVRELELEYIQDLLDNYVEEEDKSSDRDVLSRGPIGSAVLRGGCIVLLDGMKCSISDDGTPYISDKRAGDFDGMSTADYYKKIVTPYQKARRENQAKIEREIREGKRFREDTASGLLRGSAAWPKVPEGTKKYNS
jgi:hypothetical protein